MSLDVDFFSHDSLVRGGSHAGVVVTWLGTAGFSIEYDRHVVLIDPYVTRASFAQCVAGPLVPNVNAVRKYASRADAIVVGHTHFDHVLDTPLIAALTGAKVFGSRSAARLCRAQGVPDAQIDDIESAAASGAVVREVGPFELRFVASAHSRFALGRVPFPGELRDCDELGMRVSAYRCGAVFAVEIRVAGKTLFHLGSAEIVDSSLENREVDLLMLCVAGWTSSAKLPFRIARRLNPKAVVLSHWDNFFSPMTRDAKALPAMQMPRLASELAREVRDLRVGALPLLGHVVL